ncbi:uncharacterized protein (TIGR00369 family) [Pseudomonas sp. PvR086]
MEADQVVAQWDEEEKAIRARLNVSHTASQKQITTLTGMVMFEPIFAGELPPAPIGEILEPIHIAPGVAIFQDRPQRRHYNPIGTVHGGRFAALLDSAVDCAAHSTLPAGTGFTTLELKVNMVRALTDAVPLVRAEGKLIHAGRRVATAEGRIVGPDEKPHTHATTTCLLFDFPTPPLRIANESA